MSNGYKIQAVVGRLRDGWEAWVHRPRQPIHTDKVATREAAVADLTDRIRNFCRNPAMPMKRSDEANAEIIRGAAIVWFDPAKDFHHCDTGYIYDDNGNTDKFATFLCYEGDKAKVMYNDRATGDLKEELIDPATIKPMTLYGSW